MNEAPSPDEPKPAALKRRRRFSADTINDLLFWGIQFALIIICMGIVWYRIDTLAAAIRSLLTSQAQQIVMTQAQVKAMEDQAALVRSQEDERTAQLKRNEATVARMFAEFDKIQEEIRDTLNQSTAMSQTVLTVSQQTRTAALQAQAAAQMAANDAGSAAGAARSAAGAAANAAGSSASTRAVIASKVSTSADKERLVAQQRALAQKRVQLTRTIRQVRRNGPNILQRIFQ